MAVSPELDEELRRVVGTYAGGLARLAYSYVRNPADAEDIAQDTLLAWLEKRPVFESAEHERAWLFRVARNKSKNAVRAGWFRLRGELTEELPAPEADGGVLAAVLALPEKYRVPLHLFYCEGFSLREIAELLRTNVSTVGTRLRRGRKLLSDELGGDGDA